jgi:hypothetical protein
MIYTHILIIYFSFQVEDYFWIPFLSLSSFRVASEDLSLHKEDGDDVSPSLFLLSWPNT